MYYEFAFTKLTASQPYSIWQSLLKGRRCNCPSKGFWCPNAAVTIQKQLNFLCNKLFCSTDIQYTANRRLRKPKNL